MTNIAVQSKSVIPTVADIKKLISVAKDIEQLPMPLKHHHSENSYVREIFMARGMVVIGKKHATRHLNIVVSGECLVWTVHGKHHIKVTNGMPVTFESMAGVQKVLYMISDVVWMTVHPTSETNEEALEGIFITSEMQGELFPELDEIPLIGEDK